MLPLVASSERTADVVASVWRCCVHPAVASSFGSVFSVWFSPAGEQLGLQIIRPHYSGVKRPDSDVRMRRAVVITPRLIASQEPIFLYSHSQNRFKVFTTSVSNIQCIQAHLDSFVCRFCTDAILIFICSYSYPNVYAVIFFSGIQKTEWQFLSVFPLRLA